jgi:hypothetical protein
MTKGASVRRRNAEAYHQQTTDCQVLLHSQLSSIEVSPGSLGKQDNRMPWSKSKFNGSLGKIYRFF